MSNIDNAIVSNVLCYISTARQTYSNQNILSICNSFYSCDKIVEAKELLFSFSDESPTLESPIQV